MSRRPLVPLVTMVVLAAFLVACGGPPPAPTAAPAKLAPTAAPAAPAPTKAPAAPAAAPTKAAAPAAASIPKTDIRLGHSANPQLNYAKGTQKFADLVKERTGGQVTVNIFGNSQLGTEPQLMEQLKSGVTQMTTIGAAVVAAFPGWEPLGVFSLPYIMKGNTEADQYQVFIKLARSSKMKGISDKAAATSGIRALDFSWWYGFRNLTTKNKQVVKAADVKGLKIRTPDAPIHKVALQTLGASVVGMGFAELYSALQMGVVDGQENPAQTIYTNKFYEVQKYMALSAHMTQHQFLMINDKFYQGLTPEVRKILDQAAIEAGEYQSKLQLDENKQSVEDLKAKGMTVTEIDRADWADKTKDAWKQFQPGINQELIDWFRTNQ